MTSTNFSIDTSVLIYTVISALLCVVIYKARSFSRFDWHSEKLNEVVGSGKIYQVDGNGEDPARNAAISASNVTNSMSPANGAALLVLAFFLFGSFMGAVAIPAALGMMTAITTLNLLALIVAGLTWGIGLGRLTMSLTKFAFQFVVLAALLLALLYVVNFVFSFLNGGKDLFWDRAASKVSEVTKTVRNYDREPKGTWFYEYEKRRKLNLCALYEAIATKGNIEATLRECDRAAWTIDQKTQQTAREEKANNEGKRLMNAFRETFERLNGGIKEIAVPRSTITAIGTWSGTSECGKPDNLYRIVFAGDASNLHGVIQIIPPYDPDDSDMAGRSSAYRFTGTQEGESVSLHAGDWIQKGTVGEKRDFQLRMNRFRSSRTELSEENPAKDCGMLKFRVDSTFSEWIRANS